MNPPVFPSELPMLIQYMADRMEAIGQINAAIQGRASSEDSGRKVQLQQQRALGAQAPIKRRHDRQMGRVLLLALKMMRDYGSDERLITIIGENNRAEMQTLKMADLAGTLDIHVVNGRLSSDPTERALQFGHALERTSGLQGAERNRAIAIGFGAQADANRIAAGRKSKPLPIQFSSPTIIQLNVLQWVSVVRVPRSRNFHAGIRIATVPCAVHLDL